MRCVGLLGRGRQAARQAHRGFRACVCTKEKRILHHSAWEGGKLRIKLPLQVGRPVCAGCPEEQAAYLHGTDATLPVPDSAMRRAL